MRIYLPVTLLGVILVNLLDITWSAGIPDTPDIHKWRPSLYSNGDSNGVSNGDSNGGDIPKMKHGRFDTTRQVAHLVRQGLRHVSPQLQDTFGKVLSDISDLLPTNTAAEPIKVNYCNMTDSASTTAVLADLQRLFKDDSETCPLCTDLFSILQFLACEAEYQNLVDALIFACELLLDNTGVSNRAMCNGTITMQAPFVFTTLQESTPYDFCETLNMCFPPAKAGISTTERVARLLQTVSNYKHHPEQENQKKSQHGQIKILQLADIHVSTTYTTGSAIDCGMYVCCLDEFPGNGSAREYGEYKCNIPEKTMHHILEFAATLQPDFVIFSGDSPPHTIWDETLQSQLNCSNIVVNALKQRFPDTKVYPNIGNRDLYPTNVYTMDVRFPDTKTMNNEFVKMWRDLAGFQAEQEVTMNKLAYYTMAIPGFSKLRLLSINTNHYWFTLNSMATLNRNGTENAEQRSFINQTLADARENGEKVLVVGHHPVSSPQSTVRATRWWESVIMEYSDVIIMFISGYTHHDEFHLFLDPENEEEAKAINYVAPSFTANTDINPSIRLFYLDADTFDLINFENYFADLDTQQPAVPPPVKMNYEVQENYGMRDLSPASWKELSLRFVNEDDLFQNWFKNWRAQSKDEECTGRCKKRRICSMWFPNYDELDACVVAWEDYVPVAPTDAPTDAPTHAPTDALISGTPSLGFTWTLTLITVIGWIM